MTDAALRFATIDVDAHAAACVAFRRDSFLCSFGVDGFFEEAGPSGEHYLARLRRRIHDWPDGYVHIWLGDRLIGQLEMRILDEPRIGYVHLFYLVEDMRGAGHGTTLHEHALAFMAACRVDVVQLSASPTNTRALAYYRKHGWRVLGPRPGRDNVILLEHAVP
jgi:ribosomal protein S18 acetylase RimI-like enzyme